MLSKLKNHKEDGFTIIEVLIVLAIAGLIMLIVFLAVPALQRNSRNTTIKNDASAIEGGIAEYVSNNSGSLPTTVAQSGSAVNLTGGTGTVAATAKVNGSTGVSVVTTAPTSITAGKVQVLFGKNCSNVTSARSASIYYGIETASAVSVACIDS